MEALFPFGAAGYRMAGYPVRSHPDIRAVRQGVCAIDAELLADMVRKELGVKKIIINLVGPVIGAHSGPGTLALFFVGTER